MQTRIFQNAVLMTLTAIFCCANVLAQSANEAQKIITFDKLQKTIIPLPACSQPNVKIEPALSGYKLETINGKYALVFDKPVSAGLYAIMLTNGATTEKIEWRVLSSELSNKGMKILRNISLYYGHRMGYSPGNDVYATTYLGLSTDDIPHSQFFIRTTFDNDVQKADRYQERYNGSLNIPASVKKVKFEVVWEYPQTKEEVVLASREIEPLQEAPNIEFNPYNFRIRRTDILSVNNKSLDTSFQIAIRGIRVDAEVGFDADNTEPGSSKSIKATINNVKASEEVTLFNSRLQLYNGDEPNPNSKWVADSSTFCVISGVFDKSDATFPIIIRVKGLPRLDITELRGEIDLKVKASIWNEKAGKSGIAETILTIPISIPVNMRHIGLKDIAPKEKEKKAKSK